MNKNLFILNSTYELTIMQGDIDRPIRIEIFSSLSDTTFFRARIWMQNTYNLYPVAVNTGEKGEDLHRIHSCDNLNVEITILIAEDESFINGKHYENESAFLQYIEAKVIEFSEKIT